MGRSQNSPLAALQNSFNAKLHVTYADNALQNPKRMPTGAWLFLSSDRTAGRVEVLPLELEFEFHVREVREGGVVRVRRRRVGGWGGLSPRLGRRGQKRGVISSS